MSAPTEKEVQLLSDFRAKITDLNLNEKQRTDHFLLRWIRAKNGDLKSAADLLTKCLKWREENDMDNIMSWNPSPEFKKDCPYTHLGFDLDNHPVVLIPFGRWKMKDVVNRGEKNDFVRYYDQLFETLMTKMEGKVDRQGYPVTQGIVISDLEGFALKNLTSLNVLNMNYQVTKTLEANFPEMLTASVAINVGSTFSTFIDLMKRLMSERTQAQIALIKSTSKEELTEKLAAYVPLSVLPVCYGGENPIAIDWIEN